MGGWVWLFFFFIARVCWEMTRVVCFGSRTLGLAVYKCYKVASLPFYSGAPCNTPNGSCPRIGLASSKCLSVRQCTGAGYSVRHRVQGLDAASGTGYKVSMRREVWGTGSG